MQYEFTPGALRALAAAAGWTADEAPDQLGAPALLLGLLAESECRAALMLARHAIDAAAVRRQWPDLMPRETSTAATGSTLPPFSADVEFSLQAARQRLAEYPPSLELATEHLLLGLVAAEHHVSTWLRGQGLDPQALEAEIHRLYGHRPGPLPFEPVSTAPPQPTARLPDEGSVTPVFRLVDAAANRAREGLRVVEDYVRFVLDDRHLTAQCKQLRHDLAAALAQVSTEARLAARETQADVGTELATAAELRREDISEVLTANFARLQEGLRGLEESVKLLDAQAAASLRQLRYRSYTLQRAVEITRTSLKRLQRARLYVLIDGRSSPEDFGRLVSTLVGVGVHVIQLRDKQLDDRRLLQRARLLGELTRGSQTLFIVNDRPDLAAVAWADGVHLGQEDVSVKDARTIVGTEALVGVSTHSLEQARQAVLDGANYIGVGPVFPSQTKRFESFPGLELLRGVAAEIRLPGFAIGGITEKNLPEVLSTGFTRVAVSAAVTAAADPASAARTMLDLIIANSGSVGAPHPRAQATDS